MKGYWLGTLVFQVNGGISVGSDTYYGFHVRLTMILQSTGLPLMVTEFVNFINN